MIFYRKTYACKAQSMNVKRVRWLSASALIGYPIGACLLLAAKSGPGLSGLEVAGFAFIFVALLGFAGTISTGVARIAGEETKKLDEMEQALRRKAYTRAYHGVGTVALVSIIYMQLAIDIQDKLAMWVPNSSDHWSAIMWGAILVIFLLPTAVLAWSMPTNEIEN